MKKIITLTMVALFLLGMLTFNVSAQENVSVCTMYAPDGRTITIDDSEIEAYKNVGWYKSAFEAQIGFSFDDKLYNDITYILLKEAEKDETTNTKFCLGFVNDDNIPDILFSSRGGVGIFILKNRQLNLIKNDISNAFEDDKFGQYGHIEYIPKKNRIYSSYGGTAFIPTFIDIENEKITTYCELSSWHNIYHLDEIEISQLRFYDLFDAYYNDGVEYIEADYDNNMYEISMENVKKAFNEVLNTDVSEKIKMYAPDGKTEEVSANDVAAWKNVGWYEFPVRTMYTTDGRTAIVEAKELLNWVNVGWHTRNFIQMFSPDEKTEDVLLQDIEAWKTVGWYEYPVTMMYTKDGRSVVVPRKDQEDWRNVGWYFEWETITMYAPDGRTADVSIKDVAAWEAVGWYEYPVIIMYTKDGRSAVVPEKDLEAWRNVGWYFEWEPITMYAPDGRIADVSLKDVAAWKNVGWYLTVQKTDATLKREAWNFVINNISNRLYVPGSGQFPSYDSNNVSRTGNIFEVYVDYTAMNRFGIRVRGRILVILNLTSTGYIINSEKNLL